MTSTVLKGDETVKELVIKLKPEIEKKCTQKMNCFDVIEYRVSKVIGTMYLMKVDIGLTHNYVHLEAYASPCGAIFPLKMTFNNKRNDPLVPLVWRE